jgi:hypothetical protein
MTKMTKAEVEGLIRSKTDKWNDDFKGEPSQCFEIKSIAVDEATETAEFEVYWCSGMSYETFCYFTGQFWADQDHGGSVVVGRHSMAIKFRYDKDSKVYMWNCLMK